MTESPTPERRGFASLTPKRRSEIAAKGGRAAHAAGTAHRWKAGKEAETAGRKGGRISRGGRGKMIPLTADGSAAATNGPDVRF